MKQLIWLGCSAGLAYYLYRRTHRLIVRVSHRPVYEASATGLVIDDVGTIVSVNQYKMQTWLGRGSFGEVYRATDEHGESVAIKRIDRSKSKPKKLGRPPARPVPGGGTGDVNAVTREIAVMKKIDHPNCVKLFEVIFDTRGGRIFLAMELLQGGEVMHASNLGGKAYLTERAARPVVQDLLSGLSHLHSLGIIHRDIKPENLVFAEPRPRWGVIPWGALSALGIVNEPRRTVKIIDLGVAQACKVADDGDRLHSGQVDDSLLKSDGTPAFFSPEMIKAGAFHGIRADIWAVGVTIHYLISAKLPFEADSMPALFERVKADPPAIAAHASPVLRRFLHEILHKQPECRPVCASMIRHPWVTGVAAPPPPPEVSDKDLLTAVHHMEGTAITVLRAKRRFLALRRSTTTDASTE
uniref:Protein kinase domain-containing protein n=1 Tax=Haptolina ericina TaxID=156174 RepID=A0A7S3ALE3_9EUKA